MASSSTTDHLLSKLFQGMLGPPRARTPPRWPECMKISGLLAPSPAPSPRLRSHTQMRRSSPPLASTPARRRAADMPVMQPLNYGTVLPRTTKLAGRGYSRMFRDATKDSMSLRECSHACACGTHAGSSAMAAAGPPYVSLSSRQCTNSSRTSVRCATCAGRAVPACMGDHSMRMVGLTCTVKWCSGRASCRLSHTRTLPSAAPARTHALHAQKD